MDWLMSILTFVAGLVVRLLVPLALTAFLVWLLGRLDEQWQSGKPAVLAHNAGCWQVNQCPPEQRARCDAYAHPETPCWQYYRQSDGSLQERCLACKVFREAPLPVQL
jgi:hypothetical protein